MESSVSRPAGRVVIATRRSRLALWQAEHVKRRLEGLYPGLTVELLALSTKGDELLEVRLDKVGGKGLFVKELEAALAEGREDPRDALVSARFASLEALPADGVLGTSSLRRAAQIAERFPGLQIRTLRGNVETRLAKLDRGEYDAIVLAAAGLKRLGLAARIRVLLAPALSLPAAGQGALGIECRDDRPEIVGLVAPLADADTAACVRAERAVSRALGGSCTVPLGAYAQVLRDRLRLQAVVAAPDGRRVARAEDEGTAGAPEQLGERVAALLRARGAGEILSALQANG
jgi:hydroxymethylbilane synthase